MSCLFPHPISEVILELACTCRFDTRCFIAVLSFLCHWKPRAGKGGQTSSCAPRHHRRAVLQPAVTFSHLNQLRCSQLLTS